MTSRRTVAVPGSWSLPGTLPTADSLERRGLETERGSVTASQAPDPTVTLPGLGLVGTGGSVGFLEAEPRDTPYA